MGKDPVFLTRSEDILPRLYDGGWSAIVDASKHFHNFRTKLDERRYLGCIHLLMGTEWVYRGLPMGTANSPAIACRLGNSGVRKLRDEHPLFHGSVQENSWRRHLNGEGYSEGIGHGRIELGARGQPVVLIFSMVGDFFIHSATKQLAQDGFSAFMDHSMRLGFICQPIKTSPPSQRQKFLDMIYDTTGTPTIKIPEAKVT
jgi:hypothetical protein